MAKRAVQRTQDHLDWVLQVTSIPTAAGREHRVIDWINRWLKPRRNLICKRDRFGNMMISIKGRRGGRPLIMTAHLDHPAFVVKKIIDNRTLELEFRGGIKVDYFENGRIVVYGKDGQSWNAKITEHRKGKHFSEVTARLTKPTDSIVVDDFATWNLKPAFVRSGRIHTPACDDLSTVAASLAAIDTLRKTRSAGDVRILFTRAEEVGFIGAIKACEHGFIPRKARLLALENSRTFAESPIGNGPIIRVGDRISVFHHGLVFAVTQIAENLQKKDSGFKFQRKLMAGGACEATAYQAYGLDAICICLPLGNYHNMGDIDAVLEGTNRKPAKVAHEVIGEQDYHHLIDLLVACGRAFTRRIPKGEQDPADGAKSILTRMRQIDQKTGFVLEEKASRL